MYDWQCDERTLRKDWSELVDLCFFDVSSHNSSLQNGGLNDVIIFQTVVERRICSKQPKYETADSVKRSREHGSVSIKRFIV